MLGRAAAVLEGNWREGVWRDGTPYAYTSPSPRRYRHQWYWDSCFHAIVWRRIDAARARAELRTLVRAMEPSGLVPHTVFWDSPARWRRHPLYATRRIWGDRQTATTQTPLLPFAWELVADASPEDPGFRTEALAALGRHMEWLARERDPDGDGLISITHPDESGLDDSPKYDAVWGWMAHHRPGYAWLNARSGLLGWSADRIAARHEEHVEDVLFNTAYALSLDALGRLAGEPGGGRWHARARLVERALMEHCWDERRGLFFDVAGNRCVRRIEVSTWASLAPLVLSGVPVGVRRRLVEEHVLDPRRYRAPVGIPSVAMEDPAFNPRFDRFRCWRGPSWINTAWLLLPAMRRLGYVEDADRILYRLAATIEREGFREYYNPLTGQGLGARRFGWSTLIADLLAAREELQAGPAAAASRIA